ncbi:MAG TPA: hypothetical protein VHM02_13345, partial [Thermoanaerobaculia bacterium]|nr:hypothetical protein [Thermoanaerobaculia bacterium]
PVGGSPVSVAWSPLAGALFVADAEGGAIVAVDGRAHRVAARMEEPRPGLAQVRIAPGGRWGFAVNPETDEVHVFDTAGGRIVQSGEVLDGPDQIAFSGELAYLRHRGDGTVLTVPLDEIGQPGAPLPVVDFPGGEKPFGAGRRPSLAPSIVRAPGANAVLVANPADEAIYFYKEGMAAPMGSFSNAGRQPRAVRVVDRSLRERERPGVYETAAKLRRPGRYRIAFFLDSPRAVHCFEAEVAPSPAAEAERQASLPARVEAIPPTGGARAGEPFRARFRLTDPRTAAPAAGLRDVRVLVQLPDRRQDRRRAVEVAPGTYEVELVPRAPGVVFLWVESAAQRLAFHQAPPLVVEVTPAGDGGETGAGER